MVLNLFPKADYAEQQENSKALLYAHAVFKGMQAGSVLGLTIGSLSSLVFRRSSFIKSAASGAGYGFLFGPGIVSGLMYMKMKDKTEIEWQDRAWRLQRNKGQIYFDNVSNIGSIAGLIFGPSIGLSMLQGAGVFCGISFSASLAYRYYIQNFGKEKAD